MGLSFDAYKFVADLFHFFLFDSFQFLILVGDSIFRCSSVREWRSYSALPLTRPVARIELSGGQRGFLRGATPYGNRESLWKICKSQGDD